MQVRRRPISIAALAVTALISTFGVQPVVGQLPTAAAAAEPESGQPESRPDQATASAAAKSSGERVEIASATNVDRQVFAEPDGTLTAELNSGPVRAKNATGEWAPIDTTLVESNGRLIPKNVPGDISLSAGGDTIFAKADAVGDGTSQDLTWAWPTTLPAPDVDGPTATYPEAVPGGDLVVTATPNGFSHSLILNQPPVPGAPQVQLTIPVMTPGSELRETNTGAIEVTDGATGRRVATAPPPVMWDASGTDTADPAISPVDTAIVDTSAGAKIVLSPDMDFLTDPHTEYPVLIDPSYETDVVYTIADTWVDSGNNTSTQSTSGELRTGTTNSGSTKARSFLKFDGNSIWAGSTINSANLTLRNFASGTCIASSIQAARITEAWSSLTMSWTNQPSATINGQAYYAPAAGADGCPSANADWDVTDIVQTWANNTDSNFGIRLAAVNENSNNTYRRYRSAEYTDYDGNFRPKITVNYDPAPQQPTIGAFTPGTSSASYSAAPSVDVTATDVGSSTITLTAKLSYDGELLWQSSSAVASGATTTVQIPDGYLQDGLLFDLQIIASDGHKSSSRTREFLAALSGEDDTMIDSDTAELVDGDVEPDAPVLELTPEQIDSSYFLDENGNEIPYASSDDAVAERAATGSTWWDGQCPSVDGKDRYRHLKEYPRSKRHPRMYGSNAILYCGKQVKSATEAWFGLRHIRAGHKDDFGDLAAMEGKTWGHWMNWAITWTITDPQRVTDQSPTRFCYARRVYFKDLSGRVSDSAVIAVILGETGRRIMTAFPVDADTVYYCKGTRL